MRKIYIIPRQKAIHYSHRPNTPIIHLAPNSKPNISPTNSPSRKSNSPLRILEPAPAHFRYIHQPLLQLLAVFPQPSVLAHTLG